MKSMEPYHRKLGPDTWFYAKRCFLGLALTLAKHMTTVRDSTMDDILEFLDGVDQHGKDILTTTTAGAPGDPSAADNDAPRTVSYEVHAILPPASPLNRLTSLVDGLFARRECSSARSSSCGRRRQSSGEEGGAAAWSVLHALPSVRRASVIVKSNRPPSIHEHGVEATRAKEDATIGTVLGRASTSPTNTHDNPSAGLASFFVAISEGQQVAKYQLATVLLSPRLASLSFPTVSKFPLPAASVVLSPSDSR